jgi:iron(III) transport system permease protein
MPAYIVAFAYLDLLHPIGPVQGALRWLLGYDSPRQWRSPDLRSMGGAIFVLGFTLYPYVHMTARAMFMTQPAHLMEAARSLGETRWGAFWRVALPMARPALVGPEPGAAGDAQRYRCVRVSGRAHAHGVDLQRHLGHAPDLAGAAQIACSMLLVVVALVWLERQGRSRQRLARPSACEA